MQIKLMGVLFMLFNFYTQSLVASTNSWFLNPLKTDFLSIKEEFDFTKKGNVYEKTFRMPLDLLRAWGGNYVDIFVSFDYADGLKSVKSDYWETMPIQNARDFSYRVEEIRYPYIDKVRGEPAYWIPERKERVKQLLEAYHPNQDIKLKITFMPLGNPKKKARANHRISFVFCRKQKKLFNKNESLYKNLEKVLCQNRSFRKCNFANMVLHQLWLLSPHFTNRSFMSSYYIQIFIEKAKAPLNNGKKSWAGHMWFKIYAFDEWADKRSLLKISIF
ncbi:MULTISPECIES: hypothetical protein [unclassified Helicobacter]|uniref:hypothetical protein n=1 Tax=unclassified Helicobacter TaxID=2593540 RepID=UPI001F48726F|nr:MULTISPECIES: hypothetical protein [unclassified Helicobacter]